VHDAFEQVPLRLRVGHVGERFGALARPPVRRDPSR